MRRPLNPRLWVANGVSRGTELLHEYSVEGLISHILVKKGAFRGVFLLSFEALAMRQSRTSRPVSVGLFYFQSLFWWVSSS